MKINYLKILILALPVMLFAGCDNEDDVPKNMTRMEVRMSNTSALYDAVNIDIRSIYIHAGENENEGWVQLNLQRPGVYNLLDFRNGIDTLLAEQDIPSGKISQIRLLLGVNNTIEEKGVTYPLTVPSSFQNGLKLNIHDTLVPKDNTYKIWIDFDIAHSIVTPGTGKFYLQPVVRVSNQISN